MPVLTEGKGSRYEGFIPRAFPAGHNLSPVYSKFLAMISRLQSGRTETTKIVSRYSAVSGREGSALSEKELGHGLLSAELPVPARHCALHGGTSIDGAGPSQRAGAKPRGGGPAARLRPVRIMALLR